MNTPTVTPESPKEPGSIQALHKLLNRGQRIMDHPKLPLGEVKMWTGFVRSNLRKIFGDDSKVVTLWPSFSAPISKDEAHAAMLKRTTQLEQLISSINDVAEVALSPPRCNKVFIGHGRSLVWRELKDFLVDRLALLWDEFNRESVAGISTSDRLNQMLDSSSFAFLIMTAEDEHADTTLHARENVVHEIGLF